MKFLSLLFLFVVCASTAESGIFDDARVPELSTTLEIIVLFLSEELVVTSSSFLVDVLSHCYSQTRHCSASQTGPCLPSIRAERCS